MRGNSVLYFTAFRQDNVVNNVSYHLYIINPSSHLYSDYYGDDDDYPDVKPPPPPMIEIA